jgi:transposase InsO family protein
MGQAVRQLAIDFDTAKCPEREALCNKYPRHKVEEAWHRAHWLAEWRKVCQPPRPAGLTELDLAQRIITEAKRVNGDDYRISIRTLQKWQRRYETIGPDGKIAGVEALIDQRGVLASAAKPDPARSPEAIAYFESIINCENKFSVKTAHVHTLVEARKQGWKWPEKSGNTRAWWGKRCNIADVSLNREGTDVWCRKHMPSLEVDWGLIEPGELFTADHHQCDFWVDYKDGQIRPWLTAVQDCRSRCIVGWNLGPSPNQEAILLAFRMSFGDWAIPENLRIDNGKDFKSAAIVGLTKNQIRELRTRYPKEWRRIVAHDRTIIE